MKKLMLAILITGSTLAMGQNVVTTTDVVNNELNKSNTVTVNVNFTKDFTPDYYNVRVTVQEYDHIDPNNQETKLITIADIEKTFYEKAKSLDIKKSDIEVLSVLETKLYNNYNNGNYNSTQKRKISKSYSFKVTKMEELEKVYKAMRVNGILNVRAETKLSEANQIKADEALINEGVIKAKKKAAVIADQTNVTIGAVSNVNENSYAPYNYNNQIYNNNYNYNNIFQDMSKIKKSITLSVTFEVK